MFLLPAGVRLQVWSRCAALSSTHFARLPCSARARLGQSHATVHVSHQDDIWNSKNAQASGGLDQHLPNVPDLAASIRNALDQHTQATDAEKSAVLAALARRTGSANSNTVKRRRLRRRLHAALSHDDLVVAVKSALAGTLDVPDSSPKIQNAKTASEPRLPHAATDYTTSSPNDAPDWNEILVQTPAESEQLRRMDLQYVRDHVSLPSREQYPGANPLLFDTKRIEDAIFGAIQTRLKQQIPASLKPTVQFRASEDLPHDIRKHLDLGSWACAINIDLPSLLECDAVAVGSSKKSAKEAAWALIVARLHSHDDLRKLFPDGKVDRYRPDRSAHDDQATRSERSSVEKSSPLKNQPQEGALAKQTTAKDSHTEEPTLEGAAKVKDALGEVKGHIDMRPDLRYVTEHMPLPTRKDYPVLHEIFGLPDEPKAKDSTLLASACKNICTTEGYAVELDMGHGQRDGVEVHTRELKLTIPGHGQYVSFGVGTRKSGKPATAAAWLAMMSQLHTSGFFRGLETRLATEIYATKNIRELATADKVLPTPEEYPTAPASLFDAEKIVTTIQAACRKTGLHLDMKYDTTPLDDVRMHGRLPTGVTLQIKLPHFAGETYVAAISTKVAKKGVWVEMLSKLHTSGALPHLFPTESQDTPFSNTKHEATGNEHLPTETIGTPFDAVDAVTADEDMEMIDVKRETLTKEKDAKVEIYNFAARLGATPSFEVQAMRLGRQARRKHKSANAVKVSIRLPVLNIEATALSRDLRRAEVAACIAFKQKAERVEAAQEAARRPLEPDHYTLTAENAIQFFDVFRKSRKGVSITVENEQVTVANAKLHQACILVDGRPFCKSAAMSTRKTAENLAYLAAAIEVVREHPDLLSEFAQAMREGNGRILRDVPPVAVTLDCLILNDMRESLVAARLAGLPDERSTLHAEEDRRYIRPSGRIAPDCLKRHSISQSLLKAQERYESDPNLRAIRQAKADLPMSQHSAQVLELLSGGVYNIIIGATGSGKTTQVPQIILEDAIRKQQGGLCDIVCTQPRRLAASSVARRVSTELGEHLGHKVGHHVRGEARLPSPGGSITYCTTGILLQQLKFDADAIMDTTSHLIIDEVHERDINIDFLLILLKRAVQSRLAAGKTVPKVVLMSATLDPELFATYLAEDQSKCPILSVPGRTFSVQESYVDEILHSLRQHDEHELEQLIDMDQPVSSDYLASERNFSASVTDTILEDSPAIDWKGKRANAFAEDGNSMFREKEEALVPLPLVSAAVAHIIQTTSDGAILVFLPGLQEITRTQNILTTRRPFGVDFSDTDKFKICLLHSAVPPAEQREVIDPPPPGRRKIILSTNIAETSVTVPDVKYVVDTGKLREKRYDQVSRITKLQCTWASSSNVRQRAGRAGRVQEGFYYGLYSKERREKMTASGLPEILRSDLQETCLSIKAQGFEEPVATFLSQAIEPPPAAAVDIAVENLQAIEALTTEQELTALGRVLSTLPVHPALAKMVLLGIVFRCLDPMLVLSAMSSERPLFVNPISSREMAKDAQKKYARDDSDHLALYHAFTDLKSVRSRAGEHSAHNHAMNNFLHFGAFKGMTQTAEQIESVLVEHGLLPKISPLERSMTQYGGAQLNQNSGNTALVKGLLIAGFQPNLGVKRPGNKIARFRTPTEEGACIHPGSHNNKKSWPAGEDFLYTYNTLVKSVNGDQLFMRDTTLVTPLVVLLFGGKLHTSDWRRLAMDGWLRFDVNATRKEYAVRLILEYRKALDRMLNSAFKNLSGVESDKSMADDAVIAQFANSVAKLLEYTPGEQHQQAQGWIPSNWRRQQKQHPAREP